MKLNPICNLCIESKSRELNNVERKIKKSERKGKKFHTKHGTN